MAEHEPPYLGGLNCVYEKKSNTLIYTYLITRNKSISRFPTIFLREKGLREWGLTVHGNTRILGACITASLLVGLSDRNTRVVWEYCIFNMKVSPRFGTFLL